MEAECRRLDFTPRPFSPDEIVARCLTAMISEALRVLEEGIALRPVDIDALELFGYGFPRHRGGPMHQVDLIGAVALIHRIETYATEDPQVWQVPALRSNLATWRGSVPRTRGGSSWNGSERAGGQGSALLTSVSSQPRRAARGGTSDFSPGQTIQ